MTRPLADAILALVPHDTLETQLRPPPSATDPWQARATLIRANGHPCPIWQSARPDPTAALDDALSQLHGFLISPAGAGMRDAPGGCRPLIVATEIKDFP